jgi:hypothetical protein
MMPQQYQLAASFSFACLFFHTVSLFNHIPLILTGKAIRKAAKNTCNGVLQVLGGSASLWAKWSRRLSRETVASVTWWGGDGLVNAC